LAARALVELQKVGLFLCCDAAKLLSSALQNLPKKVQLPAHTWRYGMCRRTNHKHDKT
jgi:hypothetical protein